MRPWGVLPLILCVLLCTWPGAHASPAREHGAQRKQMPSPPAPDPPVPEDLSIADLAHELGREVDKVLSLVGLFIMQLEQLDSMQVCMQGA